jgi:NADPH-dependent 2,4-dienoyl-CoA reductase/sulfur reductase-like enzyme
MTETEVLVLGAGPAGIAAATAAAEHGCDTLLLDDNPSAGGQIWRAGVQDAGNRRDKQKEAALHRLALAGAHLRMGWQVFDAPRAGVLRGISGGVVESFAYRRLILATGARELFLPFPGWTLPGVFGAGGLQALVKAGFAVAGKRVAVVGSGPLLLAVAAHLREYGARIVVVTEQAPLGQLAPFALSLLRQPGKLWQAAGYRALLRDAAYRTGCWPVAAAGDARVTGLRLTDGRKTWEQPCDLIACGFHLLPNTEMAVLLGCALNDDAVAVNEQQQTSVESVYCAGEPTGIAGLDGALVQGTIAGLACAGQWEKAAALRPRQIAAATFAARLAQAFRLRDELRSLAQAHTIVCRCEDVGYDRLAVCHSWTEAKLQTRCGMGPCQGRICGPATRIIFGWRPGSVRPPIYPVPVSAFIESDACEMTAIAREETE